MSTLLAGVYLVITRKSWFRAWVGLELNLLSFLPLIILSASTRREGRIKYFLIQAIASLLLLQSSLFWATSYITPVVIILALSLKLGAAPLHFWLPVVAERLSWTINIVLLTVQKVGPFFLINRLVNHNPKLIIIVRLISATLGAVGGLNEFFLRKLLAFSSINHIGWITFAILFSKTIWVLYLITYIIISIALILVLSKFQIFHLNQSNMKLKEISIISIIFLSLGGFPPLLGFAPKWTVISEGTSFSTLAVFILIMSRVLTLFYYIRSGIVTLLLSNYMFKIFTSEKPGLLNSSTLIINLGGGLFYIFIWRFNRFTL